MPGNYISGSGGAKSNVSSANSSTTLLAANASRTAATIWNDSSAILYVDCTGGTAAATSCTKKLIADEFWQIPTQYNGLVTGIWASVNGAARITEFS